MSRRVVLPVRCFPKAPRRRQHHAQVLLGSLPGVMVLCLLLRRLLPRGHSPITRGVCRTGR